MVDFKPIEGFSLILKFLEISKMMHHGIPLQHKMVQDLGIHIHLFIIKDKFIFLEEK